MFSMIGVMAWMVQDTFLQVFVFSRRRHVSKVDIGFKSYNAANEWKL